VGICQDRHIWKSAEKKKTDLSPSSLTESHRDGGGRRGLRGAENLGILTKGGGRQLRGKQNGRL